MTLHLNTPRGRPVSKPATAIAGRLTLVGTGLGALALIAITAPALWQGPRTPHIAALPIPSQAAAPQIWLSALVVPDSAPFAAPDYTQDIVLPRQFRAAQTPSQAPTSTPDQRATAPLVPTETAPGSRGPVIASAPQAVTIHDGPPRAVPPHHPLRTPVQADEPLIAAVPDAAPVVATAVGPGAIALAALHAPTRSLMPRHRPLQSAAPAATHDFPVAAPAQIVLASLTETGLTRSRTPQPRPETVTRLASLDLNTPGAITTPRAADPRPVAVPPLEQAIANADRCDSALTRAIPRRPGRAGDGSAVIGRLTGAGGRDRDDAILGEVLAGNIPDFQRNLVPVTFTDHGTRVTICVAPDYLAVGSDRDFVRVPLGLPAAMRVAERFDMVLPTTRMVDAIYRQASVHLSPSPMEPGAQMSSTAYFLRHNATVEAQRARAGSRLGQLVSGHKKDLVLTNRLNANPGRVAIYGWHRSNGAPIQPLSTVHGAQYADYSHGIRLVSRHAFVNGRAVDLRDLLADSRLAGLVSSEGVITNRQMLASLN